MKKKANYVQEILKAALDIQGSVMELVPTDKRVAGKDRKARLVIEGENGGTFYFRWTGERLVEEPDDSSIRNEIILHEDTLIDILTSEYPAREAVSARRIKFGPPGSSIYDEEEILQLFERLINKVKAGIKI